VSPFDEKFLFNQLIKQSTIMKKQKFLMFLLMGAMMLTFTQCSDDDEKPEEEDVITVDDYDALIRGEWKDDNSTIYYCGDHTFDILLDSGSENSGTWYFNGAVLTEERDYGSNYSYDVAFINEDRFTMTSQSTGTVYTANRLSVNGCYEAPMGEVVFYLTADCGCGEISVYIDDVYKGKLDQFFTSGEPDCGDAGALTVELEPGTYNVYATCEGAYWEFTTTIIDDYCNKEALDCAKKLAK
jgi:hypothetical protein